MSMTADVTHHGLAFRLTGDLFHQSEEKLECECLHEAETMLKGLCQTTTKRLWLAATTEDENGDPDYSVCDILGEIAVGVVCRRVGAQTQGNILVEHA